MKESPNNTVNLSNGSLPAPIMAPTLISNIREEFHDFLLKELERCGAGDLVVSHGHILAYLYEEGPMPMTQIAERIGRRKSTLTVLADKLEKQGYIERVPAPEDSRIKILSLTAKGRSFQENFVCMSEKFQTILWKGFSEQEKEQLTAFLFRLHINLQSDPTHAENAGKK